MWIAICVYNIYTDMVIISRYAMHASALDGL